ncbi:hypothetical protein E5Q_05186 [Mixia osmundae IAM 14324]|uniref:Uncharacterized protein n=1 Tax=Mixia osmundae (strain CBS 9802 / IAM 14324 / JCM 22182 / KY 12970) TaxID=764103 RepID=G7E6P0_MIXOS|nr:hypothetical protein E5Q_05186 [Mixia osmundae IAM 14324]
MSPSWTEFVVDVNAIMKKHVQGSSDMIVAAIADCCDLRWETKMSWHLNTGDIEATEPIFFLKCTNAWGRATPAGFR